MPSKLEKFAELDSLSNVYQNFDYHAPQLKHLLTEVDMKGKWHEVQFKNSNPIVIELACGRGEYSVALGERYPEKNFIGVDIKGNRIHTGATQARDRNLPNVAFLRTFIQLMDHFIDPSEVSEIWITFPDPFPSKSDRMKRLTSPVFLDYYKSIFKPNTLVHFKTDNLTLFRYTLGVLDGRGVEPERYVENLYAADKKIDDLLKIETYYERLHKEKGSGIHYLSFRL
jgi:tRNA (guanine-N7-)-methyltransferase